MNSRIDPLALFVWSSIGVLCVVFWAAVAGAVWSVLR